MQHPLLVSRSRGAARCFASLIALAATGCSGDYAIGDLSERSLPVDGEPQEAEQTGGRPDTQLEPFLASPDVTLSWRPYSRITAAVGDLDGDGFDDFAVSGMDGANVIAYVHVRYGGPRPVDAEGELALAESGVRLAFEENSPSIQSIGAAGDVNGDGFDDMLVTASLCDDLLPGGGAYLLYGGPERLEGVARIGDAAVHLRHPNPSLERCDTVTDAPLGLGDIDGDGLSDFMLIEVRSPDYEDPAQVNDPVQTSAHVFYGREERFTDETTWLDADATIVADQFFSVLPTGDVTANGRADFALGAELGSYYWVPGSASRLSGEVDAATAFAELACADALCSVPPIAAAGDVDGDGVDDLLANEAYNRAYLFYGAPGLLAGGSLAFEDADASFIDDLAVPNDLLLLSPAGDRDGDGDADLLSLFYSDADLVHTDVAFVSGSSTRFLGPQALPIQAAIAARPGGLPFATVIEHQDYTFEQVNRIAFTAINAGDLNGDGADDLLTSSMYLLSADENGTSYAPTSERVHIHYGTPGGNGSPSVY